MKTGILGGGQLGRMFLQAAANYPGTTKVLDPQPQAPCAELCSEFVVGDFRNADAVSAFGADCDVIGCEIEHVSIDGVQRLEAAGKKVIPDSRVLALIQDKGMQKRFYAEHDIPSAPFYLIDGRADLDLTTIPLPFVQKTRSGGYDGKGVQVIRDHAALSGLWETPSVIEALCPIAKEIAALVVIAQDGGKALYPLVEMVFDPILNLVDVVKMPAVLDSSVAAKAQNIVLRLADAFASPGVYAVELFLTRDQTLWVNETACRVHNSAHLTIEACSCSQFDQMWRVLAGMPLGATDNRSLAGMVNLLGSNSVRGASTIPGLSELLALENVFLHWYGKHEARPGRKMGHVTMLAEDEATLQARIDQVKKCLKGGVNAD